MRGAWAIAAVLAAALVAASCIVPEAVPTTNFQIEPVVSGINVPSAVRFSDDGRMFVAERAGRILEYDSVADRYPTVVTDLTRLVTTMWDRGLLSIELDPHFSSGRPYLYALFSYDAP